VGVNDNVNTLKLSRCEKICQSGQGQTALKMIQPEGQRGDRHVKQTKKQQEIKEVKLDKPFHGCTITLKDKKVIIPFIMTRTVKVDAI